MMISLILRIMHKIMSTIYLFGGGDGDGTTGGGTQGGGSGTTGDQGASGGNTGSEEGGSDNVDF